MSAGALKHRQTNWRVWITVSLLSSQTPFLVIVSSMVPSTVIRIPEKFDSQLAWVDVIVKMKLSPNMIIGFWFGGRGAGYFILESCEAAKNAENDWNVIISILDSKHFYLF